MVTLKEKNKPHKHDLFYFQGSAGCLCEPDCEAWLPGQVATDCGEDIHLPSDTRPCRSVTVFLIIFISYYSTDTYRHQNMQISYLELSTVWLGLQIRIKIIPSNKLQDVFLLQSASYLD